eukprot:CAMPEP_0117734330 /NCGR_PEP_ID=MMETSP0947-20121206/602_1 /TAXON_ID=44440 /ORGANISM="Chattonella subsalsa, Strain CCMP2191" /LENGTH=106 /DNA_ID=CAMNT_0005549073 /DNA_START=441 /DNA_END=762 /DNA_ORIENTATION=-
MAERESGRDDREPPLPSRSKEAVEKPPQRCFLLSNEEFEQQSCTQYPVAQGQKIHSQANSAALLLEDLTGYTNGQQLPLQKAFQSKMGTPRSAKLLEGCLECVQEG